MSRTLTTRQKTARIKRRAKAKAVASAKVEQLREWRQARVDQAAKRSADRAKAFRKNVEPHTVGKHGTQIDSSPGSAWVRGQRRGGRPKFHHPRRRDLPGAIARREVRLAKQGVQS